MGYFEENRGALDYLRDGAERIQYHGIDTIVKPIPNKKPGHGVDPVLSAINRDGGALEFFKEAEAKYGGMPPPQVMRELEVDVSVDVTQAEIIVEERTAPSDDHDVKLLVYKRADLEPGRPVILYIHGGAFTGGSLKLVHNFCKLLAEMHRVVVVSTEYRLAPEDPFPAGFNDCWTALAWTHAHAAELGGDPGRIIISGDSAGGNMSCGCTQRDRNEGTGYIHAQVLLYPAVLVGTAQTDDYRWDISLYDFEEDRAEAEPLARALEFSDQFMPFVYANRPAPITEPYISPLFGDTDGLPKAVIMTSEYDYLRPQAEAYVRKLMRSGVDVRYILYKGCAHATITNLGSMAQAYDMAREYASVLE
ncbi:MAG: alpha/beta hydrolase [Oscillospiraceae bacterium]|nr:alpha/beta hydrolase [Oscillospiraceae bacterium]